MADDSVLEGIEFMHKPRIDSEFLTSNSTNHRTPFSAIAELVDNARDANAKEVLIDLDLSCNGILTILDDGCGMSAQEASDVLSLGRSVKRAGDKMIGRFGNGLKSSSMKLGKDLVIFTKRNSQLTCVFLSRTFLNKFLLNEVMVSVVTFDVNGCAILSNRQQAEYEFNQQLMVLLQYSPYASVDQLLDQFDRIKDTGTMVQIVDLPVLEDGEMELDVQSTPDDIRIRDRTLLERMPENTSLKAYLRLLYFNPTMKISVRGHMVHSVPILFELAEVRETKYNKSFFKEAIRDEVKAVERDKLSMEEKINALKGEQGKLNQMEHKQTTGPNSFNQLWRRVGVQIEDTTELIKTATQHIKDLKKMMTSPPSVNVYIGLNVHNRDRYGLLVYNNGRLITLYTKLPCQKKRDSRFLGSVVVIDFPYSVLAPVNCKQGFADDRKFDKVKTDANISLLQYVENLQLSENFWDECGYPDDEYCTVPFNKVQFRRFRYQQTGFGIQYKCGKCRRLTIIHDDLLKMDRNAQWDCSMSQEFKCSQNQMHMKYPALGERKKPSPPPPPPARGGKFDRTQSRRDSRDFIVDDPEPPVKSRRTFPESVALSSSHSKKKRVVLESDSDEEYKPTSFRIPKKSDSKRAADPPPMLPMATGVTSSFSAISSLNPSTSYAGSNAGMDMICKNDPSMNTQLQTGNGSSQESVIILPTGEIVSAFTSQSVEQNDYALFSDSMEDNRINSGEEEAFGKERKPLAQSLPTSVVDDVAKSRKNKEVDKETSLAAENKMLRDQLNTVKGKLNTVKENSIYLMRFITNSTDVGSPDDAFEAMQVMAQQLRANENPQNQ